ncbi:CBS domain-containing protein [Roseomonas nepalensis]|uniref:CBS domain-containing protein n=1 Tax=Muricoccus nepalensis TaxID=1854500 RepID=A0A502GBT1_9PROT|nr:CBS domain-containing protein [Roseomonas nepalensis]TPG58486.1 CBS domain-containing protein [Roseomonas nepalensis]
MTIARILRNKGSDVIGVAPGEDLAAIARTLVRHRLGAVLVRDEGGEVLGIVSERDIVRAFAEEDGVLDGRTAADVMTRKLFTATPDTPITRALEMMTDRRVRHLPVMEDGKLRGIVSIGDLVKARIEEAVTEAAALREYVTTG